MGEKFYGDEVMGKAVEAVERVEVRSMRATNNLILRARSC